MNASRLSEIDLMRPIVILLLVLMHAFVIYSPSAATWHLPMGIHDVPAYHWVQELSYSFLLEAFTFISGYVYGYVVFIRKKEYSFVGLINNKFKRLIIPSIIFSLLYTPLFYEKEISVGTYTYDLICGMGHMWYLPMLFACFVATWMIQKIKIGEFYKIVFLLILSVLSARVPSLFRMNVICYYLFFFYIGYYLLQKKNLLLQYVDFRLVVWGYIFTIIPLIMLRQYLQSEQTEILEYTTLLYRFGAKLTMIVYSSLGTIALFLTCLNWSMKHSVNSFMLELNGYCMGIYLLQQFILKFLYYYTDLPQIGSYILPIVSFLITLVLSYIITKISCKTRIGRMLLQ